jgi:hypothetical protein
MSRANLATYLNDHLAGSVAAIDLLDHLIETTKGTSHEAFFRTLRADVAADQDVLRTLLEKLSAPESTLRKAGAWFMEKAARVKLRIDGSSGSAMERMESLEALLLGITGKRALWRALSASGAPLEGVDLPALVRRAEQQIEAVEAERIEAAREAIADAR